MVLAAVKTTARPRTLVAAALLIVALLVVAGVTAVLAVGVAVVGVGVGVAVVGTGVGVGVEVVGHKLPTNVCPQGDNNAIFCYEYNIQFESHGPAGKGNTRNWTAIKGLCSTTAESLITISGCDTGNAASSGKEGNCGDAGSSKGSSSGDLSNLLNLANLGEKIMAERAQAAEEEASPLEGARNVRAIQLRILT